MEIPTLDDLWSMEALVVHGTDGSLLSRGRSGDVDGKEEGRVWEASD